jgi:cbb3-type cytochrome oxidase subunit 3
MGSSIVGLIRIIAAIVFIGFLIATAYDVYRQGYEEGKRDARHNK